MPVDGEAAAGRETAEVIEETLQKHANEAGWDGDGRKAEKENGLITRPSFHIPFFFPTNTPEGSESHTARLLSLLLPALA